MNDTLHKVAKILKYAKGKELTAQDIYIQGVFSNSAELNTHLANFSNALKYIPPYLLRRKEGKTYVYQLNPDAKIPEECGTPEPIPKWIEGFQQRPAEKAPIPQPKPGINYADVIADLENKMAVMFEALEAMKKLAGMA